MSIVSESLRLQVVTQAAGFCEYCRYPEEFNSGRFCIDHILPRRLGGTDDLSNLALACFNCNGRKQDATHAIDPATDEEAPLFNPRTQEWHAHFAWNHDFSLILGLTATGRATIARLHMNHSGVVRQRQVLYALGLHP